MVNCGVVRAEMNPWICPKCGRVYSGMVTQCAPCNQRVAAFPDRRLPIAPKKPYRSVVWPDGVTRFYDDAA